MTRKRRPRTIVPALERSVKAAEWIQDTDEGAVRIALRLADDLDRIDDLLGQLDRGELFTNPKEIGELLGKRAYTASTVLGLLKQLELTPETRRTSNSDGSDPLEALRRLVDRSTGDVQGVDDGATPEPTGDPASPDLDASSPRS